MDTSETHMTDHCLAKQIIEETLQKYPTAATERFRSFPVVDDHGNYLLLDEGWDSSKRIHRIWLHLEIRDGKFWIHEDTTQEGVANRLLAAGVPKERIVLAFWSPEIRTLHGFAPA